MKHIIFGLIITGFYFSAPVNAKTKWCDLTKSERGTIDCTKKCKQFFCVFGGKGKYTGRTTETMIKGVLTTRCSCEY